MDLAGLPCIAQSDDELSELSCVAGFDDDVCIAGRESTDIDCCFEDRRRAEAAKAPAKRRPSQQRLASSASRARRRFRRLCFVVNQDDELWPTLTPREQLRHATQLFAAGADIEPGGPRRSSTGWGWRRARTPSWATP
ncbi:ATPase [Aureococcus anophagefferens]|nr:ATPase [Aureococcus anophagefferens]